MRGRLLIITVLAMLLICSCARVATPVQRDEKAMLRQEMQKWMNFSADGIVQINYMGFSLRKMFVLGKTPEAMRLDILDGGVLAMGASPFMSVYVSDYMTVKSDFMPQLELMSRAEMDSMFSLRAFANLDTLISRYADEVITNRKISHSGMEISFSQDLRLTSISDSTSGAQITFTYNSKGAPDKVNLKLDKSASVELLVDSIKYGDAEIIPLPKVETPNILYQLLETPAIRGLVPNSGDK